MTLALAGCGRRGDLEPPPGAMRYTPPPSAAEPQAAPTPNAPNGLFRNTGAKAENEAAEPNTKAEKGKSKPFILDPLL